MSRAERVAREREHGEKTSHCYREVTRLHHDLSAGHGCVPASAAQQIAGTIQISTHGSASRRLRQRPTLPGEMVRHAAATSAGGGKQGTRCVFGRVLLVGDTPSEGAALFVSVMWVLSPQCSRHIFLVNEEGTGPGPSDTMQRRRRQKPAGGYSLLIKKVPSLRTSHSAKVSPYAFHEDRPAAAMMRAAERPARLCRFSVRTSRACAESRSCLASWRSASTTMCAAARDCREGENRVRGRATCHCPVHATRHHDRHTRLRCPDQWASMNGRGAPLPRPGRSPRNRLRRPQLRCHDTRVGISDVHPRQRRDALACSNSLSRACRFVVER